MRQNSNQPKTKVKKSMMKKIPFLRCFEDNGIIETTENVFTKSYEIRLPDSDNQEDYDISYVKKCMGDILKEFVNSFTCQMVVRNSSVEKEQYLDQILFQEHKEREINALIRDYNAVIRDNIDIGHNNYRRTLFFVLSLESDSAESAFANFSAADEKVKELFGKMYGYVAVPQSTEDRLYDLYVQFHPEEMEQKEFLRMLEDNRKGKIKELLAPAKYQCKHDDYLQIGDKYVRMLFINSLPPSVPDSVLNDLMSVSSNCVLSVTYEALSSQLGENVVSELVEENTRRILIPVRDTVEDRKQHRTREKKEAIVESELAYFYSQSQQMFEEAKEKGEVVISTSFLIGLYADSLEELDRDTKLLRLSAIKYASQIKICDLNQDKAFQSILPLARMKVDVCRIFRSGQLASMQPLDVQQLFRRSRTFHGLNAISDNLVLLDRKNYLTGIICGIEHSGKTFACKREIGNALISTDDEVILLTRDIASYQNTIGKMGGKKIDVWNPDFFLCEEENLKKLALSAFMTYRLSLMKLRLLDAEKQEVYQQMEGEVERVKDCRSWNEAVREMSKDKSFFDRMVRSFEGYCPQLDLDFDCVSGRLKLVEIESEEELVQMMYAACQYMKKKKEQGIDVWLYMDSIDRLLYTQPGSDFLIGLLNCVMEWKLPMTMVVQDSVRIMTNTDASIEYDYLMRKVNYYKMLSQGPVERRKYVERLNIPESLVPFITDQEPGEGIIITPESNSAFNDHFEASENAFYQWFRE